MKFTKVLSRDLELDGQRYTVAMGPRGVYIRPLNKRHWKAVHWRALVEVMADYEGVPEGNEPAVEEVLAAIEDGKGQSRDPALDARPAPAPAPPPAPPVAASKAILAPDQAGRWTSKLRDLVAAAMKAKISIDDELVGLGKWLRSQAGA